MDAAEVARLCDLEERHWWYAARRGVLARELRAIAADRAPGRALDVGAAGGGNTRVLSDHGWAATALEYDAEGAAVAAGRRLAALQGDAGVLPVADRSLDLVLAMDVLEHLDDDGAALAEWVRVLRPGGTLLMTVPADPALWSAHDDAVGHRRRYMAVELRALVARAGLDLVDLRPWNVLLRPAMVLHRRKCRGSDLDFVPTPLNLALRLVIEAERFVPWTRRWRGVTLVLRAQKPGQPSGQISRPEGTTVTPKGSVASWGSLPATRATSR